MLDTLIARAADADHQTGSERAAALNAAARLIADRPGSFHLPLPPEGWAWQDGRVVRVASSAVIPPLHIRRSSEGSASRPRWQPERLTTAASGRHAAPARPPAPVRQPGSGSDIIVKLAARPQGATLDELASASNLKPHSVKAILSLRRREDGCTVVFDKVDRRYRLSGLSA